MKRTFLILILVVAFNFTSPTGQIYSQSARHNIEFVKVAKSKDLSRNELLKAKVIQYIRYCVLVKRVAKINSNLVFNSS